MQEIFRSKIQCACVCFMHGFLCMCSKQFTFYVRDVWIMSQITQLPSLFFSAINSFIRLFVTCFRWNFIILLFLFGNFFSFTSTFHSRKGQTIKMASRRNKVKFTNLNEFNCEIHLGTSKRLECKRAWSRRADVCKGLIRFNCTQISEILWISWPNPLIQSFKLSDLIRKVAWKQ